MRMHAEDRPPRLRCGARSTIPIVYGCPASEAKKATACGELIPSGCIV